MDSEKRLGRRQISITEVSYEYLGMHFQGRVSDLSQGGFFIDTISPLAEDSIISFQFSLPGDNMGVPISGEGRVAWQTPMQGMGIRFTRLSVASQEWLMSFLSRK